MTDLCALSALELRRLIGRKAVSPVEVVDACIARVEAANPAVNAIVTPCFDEARAAAADAERRVQTGEPLGLLHGVPIVIKDLNETAGVRTTFGARLHADHIPTADGPVASAVKRSGAILVGKTNTPEFGAGANTTNAVFGPTRNPHDTALTCGGSSGGSAVALATGMVPLATGSDMGGSLRIPAAFCGVVGFRPSPGLVPGEHRSSAWSPLMVEGPLARTVPDLCLLLSAMAVADQDDPLSWSHAAAGFHPIDPADLAGLRVAVSPDLGFAPITSGHRAAFEAAVARIRPAFAAVTAADPPLEDADTIFEALRGQAFLAAHLDAYDTSRDRLGPNVIANIEQGLQTSVADLACAERAHAALYRRFVRFMADYDVLICPTTGVSPFPVEQLFVREIEGRPLRTYFHWFALTYGLTLTGHPVVAIPCGLDEAGLPFGIQLCGRAGRDRQVLAIAAALHDHLSGVPSRC